MLELPSIIKNKIENEKFQIDSMGLSGSKVYLFEKQVLKIGEDKEEAANEYIIMEWLKGKLPVPQALARETADGKSWLLMTRIPGKVACDDEYMNNPRFLTRLSLSTKLCKSFIPTYFLAFLCRLY